MLKINIYLCLHNQLKTLKQLEIMNNAFEITFTTLDNNTQKVLVDARNYQHALDCFSTEYEYNDILNCEEFVS